MCLLDELKEAEESESRDFLTTENGDPIGRGSTPAQREKNRKIARNSSLLEDGYLTIREFLERTRKTFNVPLPADDEAVEDELNAEEAPEDIQGDVSNEDIPDIPYGRGRQRFRAGVRLTDRQRRAIEQQHSITVVKFWKICLRGMKLPHQAPQLRVLLHRFR